MSSTFYILKFINSCRKKMNYSPESKIYKVIFIIKEFVKTMIQNQCSRTSKYHKSKCKQSTQAVLSNI